MNKRPMQLVATSLIVALGAAYWLTAGTASAPPEPNGRHGASGAAAAAAPRATDTDAQLQTSPRSPSAARTTVAPHPCVVDRVTGAPIAGVQVLPLSNPTARSLAVGFKTEPLEVIVPKRRARDPEPVRLTLARVVEGG
ncbi:MAG: hypothetical protein AAF628_06110 [Planctomycetota bacterium]